MTEPKKLKLLTCEEVFAKAEGFENLVIYREMLADDEFRLEYIKFRDRLILERLQKVSRETS